MFANFNPWHHVSPGDKGSLPYVVNGIIEIPKGTRAKYELDKASGLLRLDRVLYSSVYYPANYGFIPRTLGEDKDPLDILILSQAEVVPMCIVPARIIGVMRMLDNGEQLPEHLISETMSFFEDYKKLENKTVVVEKIFDKKTAIKILQEAFIAYEEKFVTYSNFSRLAEK